MQLEIVCNSLYVHCALLLSIDSLYNVSVKVSSNRHGSIAVVSQSFQHFFQSFVFFLFENQFVLQCESAFVGSLMSTKANTVYIPLWCVSLSEQYQCVYVCVNVWCDTFIHINWRRAA